MFKILKIATKLSEFRYMHFMKVALKKSMDLVCHSKSGKCTFVRINVRATWHMLSQNQCICRNAVMFSLEKVCK